jgi:hypothetical protein
MANNMRTGPGARSALFRTYTEWSPRVTAKDRAEILRLLRQQVQRCPDCRGPGHLLTLWSTPLGGSILAQKAELRDLYPSPPLENERIPMKCLLSAIVLGFMLSLSTGFGAHAEQTREQCEPQCTAELHSCAVQVVSYCAQRDSDYDGCYAGATDKCKSGGVDTDGVYQRCISNCMAQ